MYIVLRYIEALQFAQLSSLKGEFRKDLINKIQAALIYIRTIPNTQ